MNTSKNSSSIIQVVQGILWIMILMFPATYNFVTYHDWTGAWETFKICFMLQFPPMLLYFINFYLIVPWCLFKKKNFRLFALVNFLLITAADIWFFVPPSKLDEGSLSILGYIITAIFFFMIVIIAGATGMRYVVRWNEMELKHQEELRKNAETELEWLKNQLNPHFLFNTLNNISSLVQVDADMAQDSLGQLSDLLRYALYDSRQKEVPLENEIEFMRNYIDLMRLRCNDTADIQVDFPHPVPAMSIIPLLFISPIENAFKHGINNRRPSFIHIRLEWTNPELRFEISNSIQPKAETDRIGSGIGIENLRRRLELAYPGRHSYQQNITANEYHVLITIKP